MPKPSSTPSRAFTLIELLVVIAIIAILAAILFPVFAQAREKARAVACMSNMKQLGTATQMYIQDNDERMFYRSNWAYSRSGNTTTAGLNLAGNPQRWWNLLMPYVKSNALFACPSDPSPSYSQDANGTKDASGNYTIRRSYIAVATAESLSLAQIDDPVETVVIVDKWETVGDSWMEPFNGDFNVDPSNPARMWVAGNRHQGMVNCAFFDGHAKAMKPDVIRSSKDLTGCNLVYHYPYLGTGAPTVSSPTTGTPQPPANVCTNPSFGYN